MTDTTTTLKKLRRAMRLVAKYHDHCADGLLAVGAIEMFRNQAIGLRMAADMIDHELKGERNDER